MFRVIVHPVPVEHFFALTGERIHRLDLIGAHRIAAVFSLHEFPGRDLRLFRFSFQLECRRIDLLECAFAHHSLFIELFHIDVVLAVKGVHLTVVVIYSHLIDLFSLTIQKIDGGA